MFKCQFQLEIFNYHFNFYNQTLEFAQAQAASLLYLLLLGVIFSGRTECSR